MQVSFSLQKTLPLFFGIPTKKNIRFSIHATAMLLFCAVAADLSAKIWDEFPFFWVTTLLLLLHSIVALTTTAANFLYLVRYFLVWLLIFGTAFVWAYYPGEVFVAPLGLEFQTVENTRILIVAGIFSLCGSLLGWQLSLARFSRDAKLLPFTIPNSYKRKLRRAGMLLAISFALLYVWKSGGIVGGGKVYADGQEGFDLQFGVFNLFHFTGIALILLAGLTKDGVHRSYILVAILTLIPGMMAGSRADFLPQAFIVFILLFNPKVVAIITTRKYWHFISYFALSGIILFVAYLVSSFIAIWRSGGIDPIAVIHLIFNSDRGLLINDIYGHKMLYFETGNMMLGGLYSAIVQVQKGFTGLLFGESYFNYLLISPPAFIGLPRPLGLEWATNINGQTMTQGGIFEVAEAYWNFGLAGCFFVSFGLSYFFAWLLRRGLVANNYFLLVWYIVFGLHGFRSIWYQNFAYFRLMTVMLVIYLFSLLYFRWFVTNHTLKYGHGYSASALSRSSYVPN